MKTIAAILSGLILVLAVTYLYNAPDENRSPDETQDNITATAGQRITLEIEGMYCTMCEQNCKRSLEELDDVRVESISASEGVANLIYSGEEPINDESFKEAVESAGYTLNGVQRQDSKDAGGEAGNS